MLDTPDTLELTRDLQQIQRLIQTGEPVAPEERLERGRWVRVRSGIFAGFEGIVIKRHSQTRLVVSVHFLQQGASVMLDDCLLEAID
jgi:transcription antitermination factor NusG